MDRKDSVPAVSQPAQRCGASVSPSSTSCLKPPAGGARYPQSSLGSVRARQAQRDERDAHCSFTTLFSSGIVMSFEPNSTPSCGEYGSHGEVGGYWLEERTVGSGFARNRWSVKRTSREDFPTAASPVLLYADRKQTDARREDGGREARACQVRKQTVGRG